MKKNKPFYGWLFAVIMLCVLLGISVYLGLSGWYFTTNFSQTTDIVLGNSVEVSVKPNEANSVSFSFSGGYLQGEKLPQIVSVKNDGENENIYMRAKIFVFQSDNSISDMSLVSNSNWTLHDDGYYYYNDALISQGKVGLCSHVKIGEESKLCGSKSYIMTILIETLDTKLDVESIWGLPKSEFLQNV